MATLLSTLKVVRVIIHDVPYHAKRDASSVPVLSEVESPLTGDLPLFFAERIKATVAGPSAFAVIVTPRSSSPVPKLIAALLKGTPNFVRDSQEIARHLHAIQTGVNPGGLLAVIECVLSNQARAIAILKLEREEGVRLRQSKLGGKATFDLGHIRDLIFTEKTKLFKAGLFVRDPNGEIEAKVSDQQRGYLPRIEVASFFLGEFLGCQLREDPTVSTKHFFEATEEFLNTVIADPLDRANYHMHLISEITSQRSSLNPRDFANTYLKVEDRQPFLQHLSDGGIPIEPFPKNTELIATRLKTTILEFESGIQLRGPQPAISEKVSLKKRDETTVEATITDKLKRVRNK